MRASCRPSREKLGCLTCDAGSSSGRQHNVLVNQGLLGIAFFEATAFIVLLVLFFIFQRDHINKYFRLWVAGWIVFTLASLSEVLMLSRDIPALWLVIVMGRVTAMLLFSAAAVQL